MDVSANGAPIRLYLARTYDDRSCSVQVSRAIDQPTNQGGVCDREDATMAQLVDKAKGFVADKVARVQKPEAELSDLSVQNVGRGGATLAGRVDVRNPYSHSIPICEVSYSLKSAGREVASGTMPDPGSLTAGDTTRLDIPVKVPYDFLVSLARDAGRDWDIDYEMRVGLTVDLPILGNFTLPLTKSGELKLPTLTDIF